MRAFQFDHQLDVHRDDELGLGLSICKEIVNLHNGNIIANHSKLGGLHIQIEFPIKGDKNET